MLFRDVLLAVPALLEDYCHEVHIDSSSYSSEKSAWPRLLCTILVVDTPACMHVGVGKSEDAEPGWCMQLLRLFCTASIFPRNIPSTEKQTNAA